eukprot:5813834-Amphidinium_carterae.1
MEAGTEYFSSKQRFQRHGTLEALARALRLAVSEMCECDLRTAHPIHHWMVRHANWLRERFGMTE